MNRLYASIIALFVAFAANSVFAQYALADVELEGEQGNEITVVSRCAAKKGGEAQEEAIEGAFNTLLTQGIPGLNGGQPMLAGGDNKSFLYRFFHEQLYNRYLSGKPVKLSEKKVNNVKQVEVRLSIRMQGLKNCIKQGGASLSPAWSDGSKEVSVTAAVNPTIIVVPYVEGTGDDSFATMKSIMDNSPVRALAVDEIMSLFSAEGFKTRDMRTALKNSKISDILGEGDVQDDAKTMVVRELPGDIVVTVDTKMIQGPKANGCNLTIRAVEQQTESVLGNVNFASGMYMTNDSVTLVKYAVKNVKSDFIKSIRKAFDDMVANGRSMAVEFNIGAETDWDFGSESPATGNDFMEALEDWLSENCYKGVYDMGRSTDKYIAATISIPVWDTKRNKGYTTSTFTRALRNFLKKELGGDYKAEVTAMGQKIRIVIK